MDLIFFVDVMCKDNESLGFFFWIYMLVDHRLFSAYWLRGDWSRVDDYREGSNRFKIHMLYIRIFEFV